jgi:mono/diheme cytochrome c family protein
MRRLIFAGLFGAALMVATDATAQQGPDGNPAEGKRLALELCAGCHVVAEDQERPAIDVVPAFAAIAERPDTTAFRIRVFLQDTPHPVMPNFVFADNEVDDLIAYILSLRAR